MMRTAKKIHDSQHIKNHLIRTTKEIQMEKCIFDHSHNHNRIYFSAKNVCSLSRMDYPTKCDMDACPIWQAHLLTKQLSEIILASKKAEKE